MRWFVWLHRALNTGMLYWKAALVMRARLSPTVYLLSACSSSVLEANIDFERLHLRTWPPIEGSVRSIVQSTYNAGSSVGRFTFPFMDGSSVRPACLTAGAWRQGNYI